MIVQLPVGCWRNECCSLLVEWSLPVIDGIRSGGAGPWLGVEVECRLLAGYNTFGTQCMRRLQPCQKDRRKVRIPDELRESLRQVHELVVQAKRDPDIRLDYDDAIQVGAVCGGQCGKKPRPYEFTYYPESDSERGRWYFALDHTEIEDIGDGRMTEIAMYCCTSPDCRSKFRDADTHCFYCDYFDDPEYGTFEFPLAGEKLIQRGVAGLNETSTKEDVVALLGKPDEIGGGITHKSLGYIPPWISYARSCWRLRFKFRGDSTICGVTALESNWEPGK